MASKKKALDRIADALLLFADDKDFRQDLGRGILALAVFGFIVLRWLGSSRVEEGLGFAAAVVSIAVGFVALVFVVGWALRKGWERAGRKN